MPQVEDDDDGFIIIIISKEKTILIINKWRNGAVLYLPFSVEGNGSTTATSRRQPRLKSKNDDSALCLFNQSTSASHFCVALNDFI